jgi:hypothetical protein
VVLVLVVAAVVLAPVHVLALVEAELVVVEKTLIII